MARRRIIAEGSLAEVAYCLHAAWRLGYISDALLSDPEKDLNGVGAPLSGLIRSVRSSSVAIPSIAVICGFLVGHWLF